MFKDMSGINNPFYGHKHSPETLKRLSEIAKQRVVSKETCHKISLSHMGEKNSFYGKHHKESSKLQIGISKKGQKTRLGTKHKPESIKRMSEVKIGNHYSKGHIMPKESKEKLSKEKTGKKQTIETKLKRSNTYKIKWQNPEYADHIIMASSIGMSEHPNKPETILTNLLNELYPEMWKFVGDDKKYKKGHLLPDFINKEDNKIIEHFGVYTHGQRLRKYHGTEQGRIEYYSNYGYKTLVIWDVELYNQREIVIQRIKDFVSCE
jgi:hypothetical protein